MNKYMTKAKQIRTKALLNQVELAELPLRRRAAKVQAAAHRTEALKALKADAMRSNILRLEGVLHLAPSRHHQNEIAIERLKEQLRKL